MFFLINFKTIPCTDQKERDKVNVCRYIFRQTDFKLYVPDHLIWWNENLIAYSTYIILKYRLFWCCTCLLLWLFLFRLCFWNVTKNIRVVCKQIFVFRYHLPCLLFLWLCYKDVIIVIICWLGLCKINDDLFMDWPHTTLRTVMTTMNFVVSQCLD